MNILIIAPQPFYQQRGTPIAVKMLAEELATLQHRVDLLVYQEGENVSCPGVVLHRIGRLPFIQRIQPGPSWKKFPCDLAMFFYAWRIVRRNRIDLIHAVEESAFLAMALKILCGVPYVYDMDSSLAEQTVEKWKLLRPIGRLLEWLEGLAVRQSSGVVAVCKTLEEKAKRYAPDMLVQRLEDVAMSGSIGSGLLLREELGFDGPILLYVGNLERYQGIDLLLASFATTQAGSLDPHLVIIGGVAEHIEHYRQQATALGIRPRTHFLGPRPLEQLGWYLQQADVLVSPRVQGTNTPMKIYSYLASGRPVIATRMTTHTQVLDDEISFLADPTPAAMSLKMQELLLNPIRGLAKAESAKRRVFQEYSAVAFRVKLTDFYSKLQSRLTIQGLAAAPAGVGGKSISLI